MHGIHVTVDLLYDFTQPCVFVSGPIRLCLLPEFHMAADATDLSPDALAVGRLGNILVTAYAILTAMHAVLEFPGRDMQVPLNAELVFPGKIFPAVTTQAAFIFQFGV